MSKRDAIIISVLVNAGLLAILFVTAIKSDPEQFPMESEVERTLVEESSPQHPEKGKAQLETPLIVTSPLDEVDNVLREYLPQSKAKDELAYVENKSSTVAKPQDRSEKYIEVTVKRGDALEKIARNHGTSVEALRKANRLNNDKLKIGQVLRIPQQQQVIAKETKKTELGESTLEKKYYTIKSGDNPWKIAKQFNVKFDDLLDLNNLDEDKARNLKVGDRIRVK
ncbi:putative muropeptidase (Autolysin) [Chlamydiales bacterium STE3]|nr:putative muropeptidase (Autolysin) [Chlamydiales bacterium STE3]